MTTSIFDKIGTLADRLRSRLGREFGSCRTCGKPTRSHQVGDGVQCHACHADGRHVLAADGGPNAEEGPSGQDDGPDSLEDAIRTLVAEWLDDHDALSRATFDEINSQFIRAVGEPATHPEYGRNVHFRETDPTTAGVFAADQDIPLLSLDDDPDRSTFADLHGWPHDGQFVPVLVTVDGPVKDAADIMHAVYHAVDDTAECSCRAATDGGLPANVSEQLLKRLRLFADQNPSASPAVAIGEFDALSPDDYGFVQEILNKHSDQPAGDRDRDGGDDGEEFASATDESTPHVRNEIEDDETHRTSCVTDGDSAGEADNPASNPQGSDDRTVAEARAVADDETATEDAEPISQPDTESVRHTSNPGENADPRIKSAEREGESDTSSPNKCRNLDNCAHDDGPGERDQSDHVATPSGQQFYPDWIQSRDWWIDWVLAKPLTEDGQIDEDAVATKQPVAPYRNGEARPVQWNYGLDAATHPTTDFETVDRWEGWGIGTEVPAPDRVISDTIGTGIIIPPGQDDGRTLTLLDWDDVRDPETEEIHPVAAKALEECDGYAEISQSGEGIHQFVFGEIPGGFKKFIRHIDTEPFVGDDRPQIEMYQSGRVCAMTGRHIEGTGDDVVEGQDLIDELCWRFGTADNAGPGTPTDPFANERDDNQTVDDETPDHETVGSALREASAYTGDSPDDWDVPEGRSLEYHAVMRARERSDELSSVANWELLGYAAALGYRDDLSKDEIKADLQQHKTPQYGYDESRAEKEIRGVFRKAENGNYAPPTTERLIERGILPESVAEDDGSEYVTDPREVDVVLDPQRAWDAAGLVTPNDLDSELSLPATDDEEAWQGNTGPVDIVRAVAIVELNVDEDEPLETETYDRAYRIAREEYGAPLPEYVTEADATDRWQVVQGAVQELGFFDLNPDALCSEVTDAEGHGDAVKYIDPTPVDGWRDSESGESIMAFDSGTVWDADTEEVIDALRLVALEAGLIDTPTDSLEGGLFEEAYRLARTEYDAPLPRWEIGTPEYEPVLPPADELVESVDLDESLDDARDRVESLYRQLARGERDVPVSVLQALPSLGKTTSAIKGAADGIPTTYLAPRKELMDQAAGKAKKWGASYAHLPVFGGSDVNDQAIREGAELVREEGKDLLKDAWTLLDRIDEPLYPEDDDDGSSTNINRPTCGCAEGNHHDGWTLVVHVARELDYHPRDIHERSEALFGSLLPCQEDGDCEYSIGWDEIANPDNEIDLLIGSYVHAYVESARTYHSRDERGERTSTERAVVLDEFVGGEFTEEFDEIFVDHALWLASALRDDIEDQQDLFKSDLWDDDWVRAWLRGDGDEGDLPGAQAAQAVRELADLVGAVDAAEELRDRFSDFVSSHGFEEPLAELEDAYPHLDGREASKLAAELRELCTSVPGQRGGRLIKWINDDIVEPLQQATGLEPLAELPDTIGGDLEAFVEDAVDAAHHRRDGADDLLQAAGTALAGGDRGCRELAVHADDGYANQLAHRLLEGVIAPAGDEDIATTVETSAFDYDDSEGTRLKHVEIAGEESSDIVLVDRNHNGATVLSPPDRTAGNGEECPVIGLDATARRDLWSLMLGTNVDLADIHETRAERARFLRDELGLKVVQTSDRPRPYSGDPGGKDLDGDVGLIEEIEDKFAGVHGAGDRHAETVMVGNPAVITTKCVRTKLEADERLNDKVAAWDNYGNITGDNDLGHHQLGAILGSQHYGDHAIEKVAALAGEEVTRSGHGQALDYGSDIANTYHQHMSEDQAMQAILRFTRGESGAVVFARTSALRRDLPVVGRGEVVKSWSETASTIAKAWKRHDGEQFTVSDVADSVDVQRRQVRRVLDEFVSAGYLTKHETGDGLANEFSPVETPSAGQVELPGVDVDPDTSRKGTYYTKNVRVHGLDGGEKTPSAGSYTKLPAPDAESASAPPG